MQFDLQDTGEADEALEAYERLIYDATRSQRKLFTTAANGVARAIVLAGGESVPNGDGILLDGKTLYVVQNALDTVAKITLASNFRSGRVVRRITAPGALDFPTTIADLGSRLYAVNARFDFPMPNASTDYWVTQLRK